MAVGVLVLWRTIAWLVLLAKRRTWSVAAEPLQRRPRRHRRLGDATRRRVAVKRARELVAALAQGWPQDPAAHLSDGVVLGAGEVALQRSKTHFSVWATRSTWLSHTRVRGWGRHAESSTGEVSVSGWQEHGEVTWLVTSARLYGRAKDGEIFSIWWARLDSLEVDLDTDRIVARYRRLEGTAHRTRGRPDRRRCRRRLPRPRRAPGTPRSRSTSHFARPLRTES